MKASDLKSMPISNRKLLIVIIVSTLLLFPLVAFTSGGLRIFLGLCLVLFSPGYALLSALFPRKGDLGGLERIALSFGLSIAVVALIGLILNYTPWGIGLYPIIISLTVFILAVSGIAWYRGKRMAQDERFVVSLDARFLSWKGRGREANLLSVFLIMAVVGAVVALGHVIATPRVGERFTEFYILGLEGKAEHYPETLKVGEVGRVILGIANHEQEQTSYRVEVRINGEQTKLRISNEDRDAVEVEVGQEQKWEGAVGFVPWKVGERQKVEFLLYKGVYTEAYLGLQLWVDVERKE